MSDIEKAMKEAHKFADKAIKDAGTRTPRGVKDWLFRPVVIRRVELVVLIGLLGWSVTYGLGMYING